MRTQDTQKNELKPWNKKSWVIPPKNDAAFVARMEAIPDLYATKLPDHEVLVCMDESNKQLIGEVKEPIACVSGHPIKEDYAYIRNGTRALFLFVAPDEGKRAVMVEKDKTAKTWIENMRYLSDTMFPDKEKIHVVMDNFKTHKMSAFYEYLPPKEANRLMHRFEFHFTPVHASWLNIAEIEFSALFGQALNKRIPTEDQLTNEIQAWQVNRNSNAKTVEWKFTSENARVKLKKLYPSIEG